MNFQNFEKDHVQPVFTRNTCDSTRRKCMFVSVAMAISEIFTKKVTRLIDNTDFLQRYEILNWKF